MKIGTSHLAQRLIITRPSVRMTNHPQTGRGKANVKPTDFCTRNCGDLKKFATAGRPSLSAVNKAIDSRALLTAPATGRQPSMTCRPNNCWYVQTTEPTDVAVCVENTWRWRRLWPSAFNIDWRSPPGCHTRRPALCIARWSIWREAASRGLSASMLRSMAAGTRVPVVN